MLCLDCMLCLTEPPWVGLAGFGCITISRRAVQDPSLGMSLTKIGLQRATFSTMSNHSAALLCSPGMELPTLAIFVMGAGCTLSTEPLMTSCLTCLVEGLWCYG